MSRRSFWEDAIDYLEYNMSGLQTYFFSLGTQWLLTENLAKFRVAINAA